MAASDEHYMQEALKEARKAFDADEVPIGAVIVIKDKIIARAYNQVEKLNDSTAHAEIIALTSAYNALGSKYLPGASLYVTIEPCLMCSGALYWSKISKIVFGAPDEKHGALTSLAPLSSLREEREWLRNISIAGNVCREECVALMRQFFKPKR